MIGSRTLRSDWQVYQESDSRHRQLQLCSEELGKLDEEVGKFDEWIDSAENTLRTTQRSVGDLDGLKEHHDKHKVRPSQNHIKIATRVYSKAMQVIFPHRQLEFTAPCREKDWCQNLYTFCSASFLSQNDRNFVLSEF